MSCSTRVAIWICVALGSVTARHMVAAPLHEQYIPLNTVEEPDAGITSLPNPPAPQIRADVLVWNPATMPHPNPEAKMSDGPDRVFLPSYSRVQELEAGPVHTTQRNMVVPGADMIKIDKEADIRSSAIPDAVIQLARLHETDMPLSPDSVNPDCTDEDSVMKIGEPAVFSKSLMLPTKEPRGAGDIEISSFKDFSAGAIPQQHNAVPSSNDELNPSSIPEDPIPMDFKVIGTIQFKCFSDISRDVEMYYTHTLRQGIASGTSVPVGNVIITSTESPSTIHFEFGAPSLIAANDEVTQLRDAIQRGIFSTAITSHGFPRCDVIRLELTPPTPSPQPVSSEVVKSNDDTVVDSDDKAIIANSTSPHITSTTTASTTTGSSDIRSKVITPQEKFSVIGQLRFMVNEDPVIFDAMFSSVIIRALMHYGDVPESAIKLTTSSHQPDLYSSLIQSNVTSNVTKPSSPSPSPSQPQDEDFPFILVDFEIQESSLARAREVQNALIASMTDVYTGFRSFLTSTDAFSYDLEFSLVFILVKGDYGKAIDASEEQQAKDTTQDALAGTLSSSSSSSSSEGAVSQLTKSQQSEASEAAAIIATAGSPDSPLAGVKEPLDTPVIEDRITDMHGNQHHGNKLIGEALGDINQSIKGMENPNGCVKPIPTEEQVQQPELPAASTSSWSVMSATPKNMAPMNIPGRDGRDPPDPFNSAIQLTTAPRSRPFVDTLKPQSVQAISSSSPSSALPDITASQPNAEATESHVNQVLEISQLNQIEWREPAKPIDPMKAFIIQEVANDQTQIQAQDTQVKEMPEPDITLETPAGGFPVADNDSGAL